MRHAHSSSESAHHRDKRQFQPTITSFFSSRDEDYDVWEERGTGPNTRARTSIQQHRGGATTRETSFPTLPGTVQADLLSVGMRVRKSVPEGYKTHKTAAGSMPSALPSIQTTLSKGNIVKTNTATAPPREPVPSSLQRQRELLPFCGLHKVGGYAEQPVTNVHLYGAPDGTGDRPVNLFPLPAEAFNEPFSSSQSSSTESLPPNPANLHKRSWQEEEEELEQQSNPLGLNSNFLFAVPVKDADDEVPVSPLSETPKQSFNALPQGALRTFAQPKSRKGAKGGGMQVDAAMGDLDMQMGIENVPQGGETDTGDFDEAPFLRPWGATGAEVEMGGV
ncbi:uncharacterized protein EI97DRAFT_96219 [Westerdykella ornata]|uniref:Uncharacterized protein n=1 Tax=Westerdykella ornata TaxID=318751 RepID=A0A6A6JDI5_WESOR|nr:uncharacterized protein EI97DRAFT_96219 [Westerdykella ornata]KAF2274670.1 hypothetical protein EI97DRAFT_96219 [Westerdykella ornata]